ncbi:hypothetical protein BJ742DRAFT_844189 [Cladochytrium replicatum]|nr:hypothetical protein BJ742DRAFT_844189 [Cladochytrium replicatum]
MLELLCGTGQEEIRRQVKQDSEVTRLFRGFSKFLMEDLVCHPDIANLPSKSAKKNLCSKLAYDMIGVCEYKASEKI